MKLRQENKNIRINKEKIHKIIKNRKGKFMRKKIIILIITLFLIILASISLWKSNKTYGATSSNSPSDIQLLARAINGEARGEPYKGQVAVRSGYIK